MQPISHVTTVTTFLQQSTRFCYTRLCNRKTLGFVRCTRIGGYARMQHIALYRVH